MTYSEHISRTPGVEQCIGIVESFVREKQHVDHTRDMERTMLKARIPFVVTDERITLDTHEIERMDLFCPHEEQYREFDDVVIQQFKWGGSYSASTFAEEPKWAEEYWRDQVIEQLARDVHEVCRKGFLTRDVYGTREEYIDRAPTPWTIGEYIESGMDEYEPLETEERSYNVGTRRYGIDGVVDDRFWWETSLEAARSARVV